MFGSVPGTETVVPAGVEAWTITCERPDGRVVGSQQMVVDRGDGKVVTACGNREGGNKPR